jgi:hypothetical protein
LAVIHIFGGLSVIPASLVISIFMTTAPYSLYGLDLDRSLRKIGTVQLPFDHDKLLFLVASSPASHHGGVHHCDRRPPMFKPQQIVGGCQAVGSTLSFVFGCCARPLDRMCALCAEGDCDSSNRYRHRVLD